MSDYSRQNDFSVKDGLTTGDPNKIISGADVDAELDAVVTAVGTKVDTDTESTMSAGTNYSDQTIRRAKLRDYAETINTVAASGTTETLDFETANIHDVTLDNNCTFTFSNPPASGNAGSITVILRQDATGSRTVTWPASVDWPEATAPTLSVGANDVDVMSFLTVDGGTTYLGFNGGINFS